MIFARILPVFALVSAVFGSPVVIEDALILRSLREKLGGMIEREEAISGERLIELGKEAPRRLAELPAMGQPANRGGETGYDDLVRSVFVVGSVYNCGKCDRWHIGGTATAWALTGDGLFVTNRHVIDNAKGNGMGLVAVDGRVFPITGVAARHPSADVAIIRADLGGEKVTPLAVAAADAAVGSRIVVIGHPEGRFFFRSSGEVARYHRRPARRPGQGITWMSITADYAKGSSGSPVIDSLGQVVGIATNTQSIYYGSRDPEADPADRGPLQMVIKNCVPLSALRDLLPAGEPAEPVEKDAA